MFKNFIELLKLRFWSMPLLAVWIFCGLFYIGISIYGFISKKIDERKLQNDLQEMIKDKKL